MVDPTFGELLQKHLWDRKITEAQLAAKLGKCLNRPINRPINRSSVNRWLNSGTKPSPALLLEIPGILRLNETEARTLLKAAGYEHLIKHLRISTQEHKEAPDKPEVIDTIDNASEPNESQQKEMLNAAGSIHSLQTGASAQINTPEEERLNISTGRENIGIAINEDDQGNKAVTKPIIAQQALIITGLSSREQVRQAHPRLTIWGIPILILITLGFWLGFSLIAKPFIASYISEQLLTPTAGRNGSNVNIEQLDSISSTLHAEITGTQPVNVRQVRAENSSMFVQYDSGETPAPAIEKSVLEGNDFHLVKQFMVFLAKQLLISAYIRR